MVIKFIALHVLIFSSITKYMIQSLAPNALTGYACMLTIGREMYLHYASKTHLNLSFKKL